MVRRVSARQAALGLATINSSEELLVPFLHGLEAAGSAAKDDTISKDLVVYQSMETMVRRIAARENSLKPILDLTAVKAIKNGGLPTLVISVQVYSTPAMYRNLFDSSFNLPVGPAVIQREVIVYESMESMVRRIAARQTSFGLATVDSSEERLVLFVQEFVAVGSAGKVDTTNKALVFYQSIETMCRRIAARKASSKPIQDLTAVKTIKNGGLSTLVVSAQLHSKSSVPPSLFGSTFNLPVGPAEAEFIQKAVVVYESMESMVRRIGARQAALNFAIGDNSENDTIVTGLHEVPEIVDTSSVVEEKRSGSDESEGLAQAVVECRGKVDAVGEEEVLGGETVGGTVTDMAVDLFGKTEVESTKGKKFGSFGPGVAVLSMRELENNVEGLEETTPSTAKLLARIAFLEAENPRLERELANRLESTARAPLTTEGPPAPVVVVASESESANTCMVGLSLPEPDRQRGESLDLVPRALANDVMLGSDECGEKETSRALISLFSGGNHVADTDMIGPVGPVKDVVLANAPIGRLAKLRRSVHFWWNHGFQLVFEEIFGPTLTFDI
ncbi:hypothetical protein HDU76_005846 [Blyttiomyces sp. JEL0837]|nr:hypothetical protein HDU76_005846 [Blyttiomyces sp. JEL0837]